ncbi:interleukin-13 receptor subunit alpha-2-like [Chaetodon trifascialis]|uniref:interleukin-13 receptor subunit alpha-2-like n=1 Tax=Chaetodon trifascialis TaxID=109706 RepID=UPI0039947489
MTMMFRTVDLFVLSCLLVTVESQTGQVLPPQNVVLRWISDFEPQLSWAPPQHSMENCSYEVETRTHLRFSSAWWFQNDPPPWSEPVVMNGGFLHFSVNTICDGNRSEPVVIMITDPVLVMDLQCSIHTSKHTHCSWKPASDTPDLRFFFRLVDERLNGPRDPSTPLRACPSYTYSDGTTGCDLQAKITHDIYIMFNGTFNNKLVRNTFVEELEGKPPPLEWTVTETADKFLISWIPPDIADLSEWRFTINYTECNETKPKTEDGVTSTELPRVSHCQYCMKIKAELIISGESAGVTEWSDEKKFDAVPNMMVYAAVIIPVMFAGLAVLTLVCYRKYKDIIFPPIPEVPWDLLSSISDNNNKSAVNNQYIEVDTCEITVVTEPQNS